MGCIKVGDMPPPGMGVPTTSGGSTTSGGTASAPVATPPTATKVCSTCNQVLVQFRPHATYGGEFGFDWIRVGDTAIYGDALPYADFTTSPISYNMLGKYYENSVTNSSGVVNYSTPITSPNGWKVCTTTTTNSAGVSRTVKKIVANCVGGTESIHWKVSPTQYNTLTQRFKTLSIPWKRAIDSNFTYYVPLIALMPDEEINNADGTISIIQGNSAKLAVHIEVSIASSHIKLRPARKNTGVEFKVDGVIGDNLTIKKGVHDAHLEIRCTQALTSNLDVDVYADDKLSGRFTLLQNDNSVVVKKKVLLVEVESDCNGSKVNGTPISGGEDLLKDCLQQALIKGELELYVKKLDVTSSKTGKRHEFRNKFAELVGSDYVIKKNARFLLGYLNSKFSSQFSTVSYDYIVYFIGEPGGWNGFAQPHERAGVYFPTHSKSTIAHELFHAMGLPHTFTNKEGDGNAHFTYKATMTSNLMDYSHFKNKDRFLIYHWQWKILNPRIPNA